MPDITAMMKVTGKKLNPVLTGEYPKTVCIYSVRKKNIENIVQAITKKAAFPPDTLRFLKRVSDINGCFTLASFQTKTATRAKPATINPQTVVESQPKTGALDTP